MTVTAVDTSVLLDVLVAEARHGDTSFRALADARRRGRVIACPVVWSEVASAYEQPHAMKALMEAGVWFDPFDRDTSEVAGRMWRAYRRRGGRRTRLVADFLVAAHAQVRADALLSRDRGFARRYFDKLNLITP